MDPYENKNNENRQMNEDENSSRSSSWYRDEQKPAEDGSYRIVKPDAERGDCCYRDAAFTPQTEGGYYVPGGRGPKGPEPEKNTRNTASASRE